MWKLWQRRNHRIWDYCLWREEEVWGGDRGGGGGGDRGNITMGRQEMRPEVVNLWTWQPPLLWSQVIVPLIHVSGHTPPMVSGKRGQQHESWWWSFGGPHWKLDSLPVEKTQPGSVRLRAVHMSKPIGLWLVSCLKVSKARIEWHQHQQWHPTPVLLPGKSHGRRSLVGCSPWGCKESDTTERLHFHFSLSCIGEGNGNSLQCSCLENPRDGGAWWAAVYGVAQSRTWLKRLSSSSSSSYHNKHCWKVCWARHCSRHYTCIFHLILPTTRRKLRHRAATPVPQKVITLGTPLWTSCHKRSLQSKNKPNIRFLQRWTLSWFISGALALQPRWPDPRLGRVLRAPVAGRCLCVVLVAQSCLTFCDPMDCSPPGSCIHGISQERILELIVISFPRGSSLTWRLNSQLSCLLHHRQILYY